MDTAPPTAAFELCLDAIPVPRDKALVAEVSVFDVYAGETVGVGQKSVAISVTLRLTERTLTDAGIDAVAKKIVAKKAAGSFAGLYWFSCQEPFVPAAGASVVCICGTENISHSSSISCRASLPARE